MENKTAVKWLVSRIAHGGLVSKKQFYELVEQAKQLEKEQIEKAFDAGGANEVKERYTDKKLHLKPKYNNAEQYYKETFKKQ